MREIFFIFKVLNFWISDRTYKNEGGYVLVRRFFGYDTFEHRDVASLYLGRLLVKGEVVHHINHKRDDNRPENLCVMDSELHEDWHRDMDYLAADKGIYLKIKTRRKRLVEQYGGILLVDENNRINL